MKTLRLLLLFLGALGLASADNLTWGNSYQTPWSGFGTSPYTAIDTSVSPNTTLQIFCLDFNDEIAPPFQWTANFESIDTAGMANAQFGGFYNTLLTGAWTGTPGLAPQMPVGFGVTAPLTGASSTPLVRYQEAAWLFAQINNVIATSAYQAVVYQVAAWDLFVEIGTNATALAKDITNSGGSFPTDVNNALLAAEGAVTKDGWTGYQNWRIVTADPFWVDSVGGKPAQEFLTYSPLQSSAPPDIVPTPEPAAIVLLLSVLGATGLAFRRKLAR